MKERLLLRWSVAAAAVALSVAACLDFGAAYDDCVARGDCRDDAGAHSPPDAGASGDAGADAGVADAGVDGGQQDGGEDAGSDAGCPTAYCFQGRTAFPGPVSGLWSFGPDDVWASGHQIGRHHWDGESWASIVSPQNLTVLRSVWGASSGGVWAVGQGGFLFQRTSTGAWINHRTDAGTSGLELQAVAGTSEDKLWVVGLQGALLEYDGAGWSRPLGTGSTAAFNGIWVDPDSATGWIVGGGGELRRLSGGTWTDVSFPLGTPELRKVWGAAPDDVYAVAAAGNVYHHDGGTWTEVHDVASFVNAVWGTGPADVFVGGNFGVLHRFDGAVWSQVPLPDLSSTMAVFAIATPDRHTLFLAGQDSQGPQGQQGFVLRYTRQ